MKISELLEAAGSVPMYRVSWKGYPGNPKPETHELEHFLDDDFNLSDEEKAELSALPVGGVFTSGGPFDSITIKRVK